MHSENRRFSLSRRTLAKSSVGVLAAIKVSGTMSAQSATPVDGTPAASPVTSEVLLTGLADPRFVIVDGADVYYSESGTGGDEAVFTTAGAGTPEPTAPISNAGQTGKVSMLAADGTVTPIATDLRSYTFGANGEIVGPAGIALDGQGSLYVAVGAPGPYVADIPRFGDEGVVIKIDLASGEQTVLADLITWEIEQNPDPATIDSNLYGMSLVDGTLFVADAGGNSIIAVDATSGEISTFAVTGGLAAEFLPESGNPARGGAREIDSVPSAVVPGPDGRLYVSYITGGPFPPGIAPIDAFSLDGTKETFATGLTMTSDIAFASDGLCYASIVSTDLINQGPGQIVRIEADGTLTVVIDGLAMPAGIAFDAEDNLYVIVASSLVPGGGSLVKYTGVTAVPASGGSEPQATPVAEGGADSAGSFRISCVDTAYEPNTLTIPANTDITITVENTGFLAHDVAMDDPAIVSDILGNGQSTEIAVNLAPGTYTFYCTQVGHRQLGMEGTITAE